MAKRESTIEQRQDEMRLRMKARRKKLPKLTPRTRKRLVKELATEGKALPPVTPGSYAVEINSKLYSTSIPRGVKQGECLPNVLNPRTAKYMRQFEKEFGRDNIINTLSVSQDQDFRLKHLLQMMLDPKEAKCGFATLCVKANITLMEFLEFAKKGNHAVAIASASRHAPAVLNDIALDAMNRIRKCPKCHGSGQVENAECIECDGSGTIRISGDKDARDQFLEATGIITRKGQSIAFNLQNVNANMPGMNPFESTVARAQKVLDE